MKAKKRHRWAYKREYAAPRKNTPSKCDCGAICYMVRRPRKNPPGIWPDSAYVDDFVFVSPKGEVRINPSPVPACTRKS